MKFLKQFCKLLLLTMFCLPAYAAEHLSIMSFNVENGGAQVSFNKVIEAIKRSQADIVGLQEAYGNTRNIAKALHWKYYNTRLQIVSRFPLIAPPMKKSRYLLVEIKPGKVVAIANVHLPDEPYGPDLVRKGATTDAIEENERNVRLPAITPVVKQLTKLVKNNIPVFITGDFNSPSNLDWVAGTNHSQVIAWPVTKMLGDDHFVDSFRAVHANAINYPGYTWPAGRPVVHNTVDNYNPSKQDSPERIDFIFAANATALASEVVGETRYKGANITISPWPSDHRAVVSRFKIEAIKTIVALNGE